MSKKISNYPSFLRNLYQTKVGFGETFIEHQEVCDDGCILCTGLRKHIKTKEKMIEGSVAGLPMNKVFVLREDLNRQSQISTYYPSRTDIRTDIGGIDKDVYLVLQVAGFSDSKIQHYFGINNHEWQQFKRREFPNWLKDRDEILAVQGKAAYEEYIRTHNFRRYKLGHSYFDEVDAQQKSKFKSE